MMVKVLRWLSAAVILQSEFMQNVIQNKHLLKCANLSVSSPQRSTVAYFFWPETESGLIQFKGLK